MCDNIIRSGIVVYKYEYDEVKFLALFTTRDKLREFFKYTDKRLRKHPTFLRREDTFNENDGDVTFYFKNDYRKEESFQNTRTVTYYYVIIPADVIPLLPLENGVIYDDQ